MGALDQRQKAWLVYLSGVFAFLAPPLVNLSNYWNHNPLYGFGWFVPFASLFLAFRKCDELEEPKPLPWPWLWAILAFVILAFLPLRIIQVANPDWRDLDGLFLLLGWTGFSTWTLLLGGRRWLFCFAFPALFLATSMPWPIDVENLVTLQSLKWIGGLAGEILWMFGVPNRSDGFEIHTLQGSSQLSEACSGIRSFHVALFASLFLGEFFRFGWRNRLFLFLAALVAAFLTNTVRVTILTFMVSKGVEGNRWDLYHDILGILGQVSLVLLVYLFGWFLARGSSPSEGKKGHVSSPRLIAWWKGSLLAGLVFAVFLVAEAWYLVREWNTERRNGERIGWTTGKFPYWEALEEMAIPLNLREQLAYSEAKAYRWMGDNHYPWSFMHLAFDGSTYSAFAHTIHRPEICLPSSNFKVLGNFEPVSIPLGDTEYLWEHRAFTKDDMLLHLFSIKSMVGPKTLKDPELQMDATARVRLALKGLRIESAQAGFLMLYAPVPPEEAAQAAREVLKTILVADD